MDNLLQVDIDIDLDIKAEKEETKPRIGNQMSSTQNQGFKFKKFVEQKAIEKNDPKYPLRDRGNSNFYGT